MPEKEPDNGDELTGARTNLTPSQAAFVEKIIASGRALNVSDALRYIVTKAMEKQIIEIEG